MSVQPAISAPLPLSDLELEVRYERLSIPDNGRNLVRQIRDSQPVITIQSTRRSSAVRKTSRKMLRTLQCTSSGIQLPYLMQAEEDPDVDEIYDLPTYLPIEYLGKNGRKVRTTVLPDFLLVSGTSIFFVVCKSRDALARLVEAHPGRWQLEEDGSYRCLPGEEAAGAYGLGFKVWSTADVNWALLENAEFLRDFADEDCPSRGEDELAALRCLVEQRTGVTVEELIDQSGDSELVFYSLARGHLYANLENERLARPDTVRVFTDRLCAQVWQTATACASAGPHGDFRSVSGTIAESLRGVSDTARDVALERFWIIKDVIEGRKPINKVEGPCRSTISRWVNAYRRDECDKGCGLLGLFPKSEERGNTLRRLPKPVVDSMVDVAEKQYEVPSRPTKMAAFQILKGRCIEAGHCVPTYRTWCRYLASRDQLRQKAKREGQPVADLDKFFVSDGEERLLQEGTRPFHIVHIDHTKLDLFLVLRLGRDGRNRRKKIARVWLTIAFCAWSRCVLGYYLSFDAPSYRSCMGVLRDMVRHHERLPKIIVVDNAREFLSESFQGFCAAYDISQQFRPKSSPKHGASCERVFGTTNKQFVHNLMGNTQALRDPRSMSPEVDPRAHAVWTLAKFEEELRRYFFKTYSNAEHGTLLESPRERLERGWQETGQRQHRRVRYDERFYFLTLPSSKRNTARVGNRGEIQVENVVYTATELRQAKGKRVRVRVDPDDAGHVYAWVGKKWVECRSEWYSRLRGRTWRQVRIASQEIRKGSGKKGAGKTTVVTAEKIVSVLEGARRHEQVQLQVDRDDARKEAKQARSQWPPASNPRFRLSTRRRTPGFPPFPRVTSPKLTGFLAGPISPF